MLFLICILICPLSRVWASEGGTPQWWCRNGAFADDQNDLHLAKVAGTKRVKFHDEGPDDGPPNASANTDPGLRPGDRVVVSKLRGGWACVYKNLDASGWIRESDLTLLQFDTKPAIKAWAGKWDDGYGNTIAFKMTRDGKRLLAIGEAIYETPEQHHTGSFTSTAEPDGNKLQITTEDDCHVQMTLVADRLVVSDNNECGGMNVSFTGVYAKKKHAGRSR